MLKPTKLTDPSRDPRVKHHLRGLDRKLLLGLNETGKSNHAKHFLEDKKYVVYDANLDTQFEHNRNKLKMIWRPDNAFSQIELDTFLDWIYKTNKLHGKGLWVVFEDATNVFNKRKELPDKTKDLINRGRHAPWYYNFLFIAHKYSAVHPDMRDLMLSGIVYRVDGDLTVKALNNKRKGLGDAALELDDYHFLTFEAGKKGFQHNTPVPKVTL